MPVRFQPLVMAIIELEFTSGLLLRQALFRSQLFKPFIKNHFFHFPLDTYKNAVYNNTYK